MSVKSTGSDRTSILTVLDTNACLCYSINHSVVLKSGRKIPINLKYSEYVHRYLTPKISENSICVIGTVNLETGRKIWDEISKVGSKLSFPALTVQKLVHLSFSNFSELTRDRIHPDCLSLLSEVENMYATIWNDFTKNEKKKKWARIKKTTVDKGPPRGPDLKILATTAKLSQDRVVELLTFDNDFILFADEILGQFGISVKNGWLLK